MQAAADSIRSVTAIAQQRFDDGERSAAIDLHDVVELLLAIADELDAAVESDLLAAAKALPAMQRLTPLDSIAGSKWPKAG